MDIGDKTITVTYRTIVIVMLFVIGIVSAAVLGYFRLDAKADEAVKKAEVTSGKLSETANTLDLMQCDVRQLKNFMIYGIRPNQYDRCGK